MNFQNKKILIAYFSRRGNNYSNGKIVNLSVGNTELVARRTAERLKADLFEISIKGEYPQDYYECTIVAKKELTANSRPELVGDIELSEYDIIVLGYPNWWNTMPMAVWSFLDKHDFNGKVILPFCTNEGSGMGNSERDIKKLCPTAEVKNGLSIVGSRVAESAYAVDNWLLNS